MGKVFLESVFIEDLLRMGTATNFGQTHKNIKYASKWAKCF